MNLRTYNLKTSETVAIPNNVPKIAYILAAETGRIYIISTIGHIHLGYLGLGSPQKVLLS
jgi:hypothetical protein